MKKLSFVVMPLMAISLLASCGGDKPGPTPTEDVTFSATSSVTLDETKKIANITLDWTPTEHSVECSDFTFTLHNQSVGSTVASGVVGSRPLDLTITFDEALDADDTGDLKFHYNDKTAQKEGEGKVEGINVKLPVDPPGPTKYTLTAICNNGKVTGNQGKYEANADVSLIFTANQDFVLPTSKDEIEFTNIDKSAVTYDSATGSLSFKMPANKVTVTVTATPKSTKYDLYTTCNNGSFSYHKPKYEKDEEVILYIDANESHWLPPSVDDFDEIKGINKSAITYTTTSPMSANLTFKMPANEVTITLTAIEPTPTAHLLTARCMNGTVKGNKIAYEPNEDVALTFTADEGYLLPTSKDDIVFTGITDISKVTYDNTTGSLTFTMPDNSVSVTVTARKVWYLDDEYINSLDEDDIGTKQTLKVNGIDQEVRLIGVDHDNLALSSGKAHTTWEFVDLLSDQDGYSLATVWDWKNGDSTTNQDYLNSNLRKALDGSGDGELVWYRKGQATSEQTQQTEYANKTVLDMLPTKLQEVIKEVKKPVATTASYTVNDTYTTKLFPLSYSEMTGKGVSGAENEGKTYAFYKGDGDTDTNRIKHQFKWHDQAVTSSTPIVDGKCEADNFAGFNSSEEKNGGQAWLRSPYVTNNEIAWYANTDGQLIAGNFSGVNSIAYAVAPAFCLGEREWYQNQDYISGLTENDVGTTTQTLNVNGVDHLVRLIGVEHDDLSDNSGKAHTTWEFENLLSDHDGYSLATIWDWGKGKDTNNQDYLNSTLRKTFDGSGNGEIVWYRKGQTTSEQTQQTEYANKTVLDMLPADLKEVIKEVKKPIATGSSYTVDTYNAKVFPLSCQEVVKVTPEFSEVEGSTYTFYKNGGSVKKRQVKGNDGAATDFTEITDGKLGVKANNWAGFNSPASDEGGHFWLRSPSVRFETPEHETADNYAWWVRRDGYVSITDNLIYNRVFAVAPAFCI